MFWFTRCFQGTERTLCIEGQQTAICTVKLINSPSADATVTVMISMTQWLQFYIIYIFHPLYLKKTWLRKKRDAHTFYEIRQHGSEGNLRPSWPNARVMMNTTNCLNSLKIVAAVCYWKLCGCGYRLSLPFHYKYIFHVPNLTLTVNRSRVGVTQNGGGQWKKEDPGECGHWEAVWQDLGLYHRVEYWQRSVRGKEGKV